MGRVVEPKPGVVAPDEPFDAVCSVVIGAGSFGMLLDEGARGVRPG
jgi:hypothetical protein